MYSASQREVGEHSDRVHLEVGVEIFGGHPDRDWSHSVSHLARLAPFKVVKNDFNQFIKREMNRPKAANRPINYCTPFLGVGV